MKPRMAWFDKIKAGAVLALTAAAVVWSAVYTSAEQENVSTYRLVNGRVGTAVIDTAERATPWIPVRFANRILIRTWSGGTGAHTGADSNFTDSIGVFKVLFSDSVSFLARDSAGTIVSGPNLLTRSTDANKVIFPMCADSVVLTGVRGATATTNGDSTYKQAGVFNAPVEVTLRAGRSGSGVWTVIYPALVIPATVYGDGAMAPGYMRIRWTPKNRVTTSGVSSTTPNRTVGIRDIRMEAYVMFKN